MRARLSPFLLLAVVAGCAQFPELDRTQTPGVENAPYPALLPLDTLLEGPVPQEDMSTVARVEGRAEALQARAAGLQRVQAGGQADLSSRLARLRQRAEALRRAE